MLFVAMASLAQNARPSVIPEIREWKGGKGAFVLSDGTRIICSDPALEKVAERFAEDCCTLLGFRPEVGTGKAADGDIVLRLKQDKKMPHEGYGIEIGSRITVTAPEAVGVFWGTRTLLQIAEQTPERSIACGTMRDWPDYGMRGIVVDCGRKYIPMSYLRDLAKILSYYKMNVLHVHLNDNGFKKFFDNDWDKTYAAFRLESETFPGLAARDGYYTKKEFVDFQLEAMDSFVEIVPEIDAPAHTLAFSHYKPEIGSEEFGMDHLDLGKPETYEFMDALFAEYLGGEHPVFVGPKVHIGTDEYSNKKKEVVEQFRHFTDYYIKYIESFGKEAYVWGALTHADGETPVKSENVGMYTWYNGYADPVEMKRQGYKMVCIPDDLVYIVPAAGYYYDYLDTKSLYESWTPAHIGEAVFEEKDPSILGGMFAVWNDHCGNGISIADIHHRVYPALQTIAVKTWNTAPSDDFCEFKNTCQKLSEAPGVNRMGRCGVPESLVYSCDRVEPGMKTPVRELGYGYTVSFTLEAADEARGTVLFESPEAVFYLSDPAAGMLGFARDGYLFHFDFRPYPGEKLEVAVQGDNVSTSLYINGRLCQTLDTGKICFEDPKTRMSLVRTLMFPLETAGAFKSAVTDLKVYNYKRF